MSLDEAVNLDFKTCFTLSRSASSRFSMNAISHSDRLAPKSDAFISSRKVMILFPYVRFAPLLSYAKIMLIGIAPSLTPLSTALLLSGIVRMDHAVFLRSHRFLVHHFTSLEQC